MSPQKTSTAKKTASGRSRSSAAPSARRRNGTPAVTKRDLVLKIAGEQELAQEVVYNVLQRFLDLVTESLVAGRHIEFRDFGVFEVARRRSRIGRNPNRPENTVTIPERKVVKFKPGKRMKALVTDL